MPRDWPVIDPASLVRPHAPESCAGCQRLEPEDDGATVTLLSGEVVCNSCPAWRHETFARGIEARAVLDLPDKATRLTHLAQREAEFGAEYRRRLEGTILSEWESRRHRSACPGFDRNATTPPAGEAYRCLACGSYHEGAAP